jgi:BolA protein
MGPIELALRQKIEEALKPQVFEVINESLKHAGHRPPSEEHTESHFNVLVVSEVFVGLARVERYRRVHALLEDELRKKIHAFSMKLLTPAEWRAHSER